MTCAIWGTEAKDSPSAGDWRDIDSPRTGGRYRVVRTIENKIGRLPDREKLSLSRWIMQQHELGVELPEIHSFNLNEAINLRPLAFSEKVRITLTYIAKRVSRIDAKFHVYGSTPMSADVGALLSLTELHDVNELWAFLLLLQSMSLLQRQVGDVGVERVALSPNGWQRVEEWTTINADSAQAFVAMWFDSSTEAAYKEGIAPAIADSGYEPLRIDNKEHINKIDDEIIAEIRRSRFLVCDFTCEPGKVRGGVYFEAGLATGLPIPVIWTCSEKSAGDLHFDTRQYNHIMWKDPSDLRAKLFARIGAVLGDGPKKGKR